MPPAKKATPKKATPKRAPAKKSPPKKSTRRAVDARRRSAAPARRARPVPKPKPARKLKPAAAPKPAAKPAAKGAVARHAVAKSAGGKSVAAKTVAAKQVVVPAKKVPPLESLDFLKVESILDHPSGSASVDAMLSERMRAWNQRDKSSDWSARRSAATQWQLCYCNTPFRRLTLKGQHVISRDVPLGGEPGGRVHTWSTEIGKRINVATLKGVLERMLA